MENNSSISIAFGLLLLLTLPFWIPEMEYMEANVEPKPENVISTNCKDSDMGFRGRLVVCNANGIKWYHYPGEVDSVMYDEIEKLWSELE